MEEQPQPWYAAGLYRRIQEARRFRPHREARKSWRQRLRERGLHWSVEVVVGVFVAVVAVSLATVVIGSGAAAGGIVPRQAVGTGDGGAGAGSGAPATPGCIAAPIPGSTRRVCATQ